jgi:L-serine dehydratase
LNEVEKIHVDLFGSLSLTGKGHATDIAVMLGLCGFDPVKMDIGIIDPEMEKIRQEAPYPLMEKNR